MTRRGSLAYYMAGVVCGSFFYTLAYFLIGRRAQDMAPAGGNWARDFLFAFFLGTIFGWFPQIVAAALLRKVSYPLRWTEAWHWAVGGAGVFFFVFIPCAIAGGALERYTGGTRYEWVGQIFFGQAMLSVRTGIWQGLPAGAATSFVLYRVHRAFAPGATAE